MFLFELCDQGRHREEVVAADAEHELRIGNVAVEIGQVVHLENRKLEATVGSIVVLAVLPGWIDFGLGASCAAKIGAGSIGIKKAAVISAAQNDLLCMVSLISRSGSRPAAARGSSRRSPE
jgi:hypothetical protein